jgi:hypothetical protein
MEEGAHLQSRQAPELVRGRSPEDQWERAPDYLSRHLRPRFQSKAQIEKSPDHLQMAGAEVGSSVVLKWEQVAGYLIRCRGQAERVSS